MLLDQNETHGPGLFRVNMTPLIDVSLVLVVTLLLMTPLALESGIWVRNQTQDPVEVESDIEPQLVAVSILSEDLVQVDTRVVTRGHLELVLGAMLRQPEYDGVSLACADEVSHAAFVDVLDKAKLSGAGTIAIAAGQEAVQ
nr:biopolymer transporter ExbD [Candidatus Krumholzibacteria bacterium]